MRITLVAVLVLSACGQSEAPDNVESMDMTAADASGAAIEAAAPAASEPPPPPGPPGSPPIGAIAQIAYSYSMALELPAKQVVAVRDSHVQLCKMAGPTRCQLIGASSQVQGKDFVSAQVTVRGEPKWLEGFRAQISASAEKADGRVLNNSIGSEDLTRQLIDTEAQLRAKTILRNRLQELLANRQGKLGELLEVERELARVQGEIDSMTSQLAVMRARVSMSDLSIAYQSTGVPVTDATANPIVQAFNEFLGIVSASLASVIRLVAALLPWLLLGLPLFWWIRRLWRARKVRRSLAESPPAL
jgi:Domain of unknown function (DUF4349)